MLSQVSICTLKAKSALGSELIGYQTRKMGVWKVKILNLKNGFLLFITTGLRIKGIKKGG